MQHTPHPLLGGLSPAEFLRDYWHKKPLLIRGALTDVGPHVDFAWLAELAQQDDVESRLIECRNGRWHLEQGPFRPSRFKKLPDSDWTVLVQNVNHHLPHVANILWRFNFIPYARLDDLMISYAPPGGTVGPHFDSYDVFLLQVGGRKSWKISAQQQMELVDGAPLKILSEFHCEQEFILEHGDMLYLPPRYAHYGVAIEPGMTYSIGFRAPTSQELATQFLIYLQDRVCLDGIYADPEIAYQDEPAQISDAMIDQVAGMLAELRWDRATIADFLGHYLTEPKAHVFYDAPEDELDEEEFATLAMQNGIVLDLKSQILYIEEQFYCNAELLATDPADRASWQHLANQRCLPGSAVSATMLALLYEGYLAGYWHLADPVAQ
ncbi:cupin domain-containing protein [Crenobacter sp. SG2305]|uniref:ribosomal protein uL16 3-hydroxylase n=1 Tax=Crenobacter oryzisoli TaxID=3056844 RepID=UPI0025AB3D3C|nr:cupin domain-containing protein [Crenobacter sp. SG2305]MDN0084458.1 cupin domain-containing protein [Crenobacter sp. SG2305]